MVGQELSTTLLEGQSGRILGGATTLGWQLLVSPSELTAVPSRLVISGRGCSSVKVRRVKLDGEHVRQVE